MVLVLFIPINLQSILRSCTYTESRVPAFESSLYATIGFMKVSVFTD